MHCESLPFRPDPASFRRDLCWSFLSTAALSDDAWIAGQGRGQSAARCASKRFISFLCWRARSLLERRVDRAGQTLKVYARLERVTSQWWGTPAYLPRRGADRGGRCITRPRVLRTGCISESILTKRSTPVNCALSQRSDHLVPWQAVRGIVGNMMKTGGPGLRVCPSADDPSHKAAQLTLRDLPCSLSQLRWGTEKAAVVPGMRQMGCSFRAFAS